MLYTKIQPQSFLGSGEDFFFVLPYMGKATILFNGAAPFEEVINTFSLEGPMWNLLKIAQAISESKIFRNNTTLYMYITLGQG